MASPLEAAMKPQKEMLKQYKSQGGEKANETVDTFIVYLSKKPTENEVDKIL
jgi:hypothetical protein